MEKSVSDDANCHLPCTQKKFPIAQEEHDNIRATASDLHAHMLDHLKNHLGPSDTTKGIQNACPRKVEAMLVDTIQNQSSLPGDNFTTTENTCLSRLPERTASHDSRHNYLASTVGMDSLASPCGTVSTVSTLSEPFPDYYESCEKNVHLINRYHEEAYNYAISKVVEEVIRFREIDDSITSPPPFAFKESSSRNSSDPVDEKTEKPPGDSDERTEASSRTSMSSTGNPPSLSETETNKLDILEEIKLLLANPRLKRNIKKRFIKMTDMVLQMEYVLFRRHNATIQPERFLSAQDTFEVRVAAIEIIKYLSWIDDLLQTKVEDAERVAYILSQIVKDQPVSVYVRYRRMAHVVMGHLKKPRPLEQRLLSVFLELYDSYVYTSFLQMRNRQIILEENLNIGRLELSRLLIALWDVLNRVIENYELFVHAMVDMKTRFFNPAMEELQRSPEIWQECWERHQSELSVQAQQVSQGEACQRT